MADDLLYVGEPLAGYHDGQLTLGVTLAGFTNRLNQMADWRRNTKRLWRNSHVWFRNPSEGRHQDCEARQGRARCSRFGKKKWENLSEQ
jgi:hypothetical protein